MMVAVIELSPIDLALAAALVVSLAAVTTVAKLGVAQSMLVAAARMVVQLLLVGLISGGLLRKR